METKIIDLLNENNSKAFTLAAEIINKGGVVAFPTETVYGLGADATNEEAVKKIFLAKGRPNDNPLIVHVSSKEEIFPIVKEVNDDAKKLIDAFMPGALTLVFYKAGNIAESVSNHLDTVAVRMPSDKYANAFIKACHVPIAAPSANISGKPSGTLSKHVISDFDSKIDMILCADISRIGVESTVLDVTKEPFKLLRPGKVSVEEIEKTINKKIAFSGKEDSLIPKSPGMKYTHYKPKAEVRVISGENEKIEYYINNQIGSGKKIGALVFEDLIKNIKADKIISLGNSYDTALQILFAALREFDENNIDIIFAQGTKNEGVGLAYMNRVLKSAGGNHIIL